MGVAVAGTDSPEGFQVFVGAVQGPERLQRGVVAVKLPQ